MTLLPGVCEGDLQDPAAAHPEQYQVMYTVSVHGTDHWAVCITLCRKQYTVLDTVLYIVHGSGHCAVRCNVNCTVCTLLYTVLFTVLYIQCKVYYTKYTFNYTVLYFVPNWSVGYVMNFVVQYCTSYCLYSSSQLFSLVFYQMKIIKYFVKTVPLSIKNKLHF